MIIVENATKEKMSRCVSCGSGSALIHNKNLLISPIHNALKVRGNNRSCGLRVQVSMVDSSSADFTRRIERAWLISKVQSLSLSLYRDSIPNFYDALGFSIFINLLPFLEIWISYARSLYFKCSNYINWSYRCHVPLKHWIMCVAMVVFFLFVRR